MISSSTQLAAPSSTASATALPVPPRALPRSLRKSVSAVGLSGNDQYSGSNSGPGLNSAVSSSNLHSLYSRPESSISRPIEAPPLLPPSASAFLTAPAGYFAPGALDPPQFLQASHSQPSPAIGRRPSLAALNTLTLPSIPDCGEYDTDFTTVGENSPSRSPSRAISRSGSRIGLYAAATAAASIQTPIADSDIMADDLCVGDIVDVPGGMAGTVRFVGSVDGKKGVFAGVELLPEFSARGKNSGDVDGVSYFNTTLAGAGIFVPVTKVLPRDNPNQYPGTPIISAPKTYGHNPGSITSPVLKFSQSVGPGRSASPSTKKPRGSLGRPESPGRRLQMTPGPRQSIGPPSSPGKGKYGSPGNRFSQSVRGTSGDPMKRGANPKLDFKTSVIGMRSSSAMGMGPINFDDDEPPVPSLHRAKTSSGATPGARTRPSARLSTVTSHSHNDEIEQLRAQVEDRDRQLRDQAATLSEMESALAEVQRLMDNPDGMHRHNDGLEDKDMSQMRAMLREKNEKIAALTAEFDSHRADFRSTIDALEMASTETVRVYEAQKKDLVQEINELESRLEDVDAVANQLKQLEELVQELEEGLEDARRGEAEARGEVEFLRGEVERTRSELRREKEKNGNGGNVSGGAASANADKGSTALAKELEQKEDEIRGLKAIIHSLSRDSNGDGAAVGKPTNGESVETRLLREKQERELHDLRAMIDNSKVGGHDEDLDRDGEDMRRSDSFSGKPLNNRSNSHPHRASGMTVRASSYRDSTNSNGNSGNARERSVGSESRMKPSDTSGHKRGHTLDTMPESDTYSMATENSTMWCEICEASGHDILTCTNMFGPDGPKPTSSAAHVAAAAAAAPSTGAGNSLYVSGSNRDTLKASSNSGDYSAGDEYAASHEGGHDDGYKPAPLKAKVSATPVTAAVSAAPSMSDMEFGPVAGKESGVIDASKWCAVCERDGHDSVDCPFEDAF